MIRISPVRVIGADNEQLGVIDVRDALRMAKEQGLDLVEVAPTSRPPVCKIMDYGRFKYEQAKKDQKAKSGSKKTELKEVRLGRSMRIDPHDLEMRVNQARQFLIEGHKVQFVQPFQGREMQHKERGYERMKEIAQKLEDVAKVEMVPKFAGRRMIMIVAPDRAKLKSQQKKPAKPETPKNADAPSEAREQPASSEN